MRSGWFSLTMISWKLGSMASSLRAVTVSNDGSIPEYSLIPRTTLKSGHLFVLRGYSWDDLTLKSLHRILLATIRQMPAWCPCPRCPTPLSHFHKVGTAADMRRRVTLARVDNRTRQNSVFAARRLIYEKHCQVNSTVVEQFLKETSLVPNIVRRLCHSILQPMSDSSALECLFLSTGTTRL
jgi:hypothetical protein